VGCEAMEAEELRVMRCCILRDLGG